MDTNSSTLHDADTAMRTAWAAFTAAVVARRQAASSTGAAVGEISLDNNWSEQSLLAQLGRRIAALPTGEDLEVAVGRALLATQAHMAAAERQAKEKAEAQERFDASKRRILDGMNARLAKRDTDREAALAAAASAAAK